MKEMVVKELDQVVVRFSGDSGDGMQLAGNIFSTISATVGNDISTFPDYPADIRAPQGSLTGVSGFQVHVGANEVYTPGDLCDVLVAMNAAALKTQYKYAKSNATIIIDTDAFGPNDLKKAAFESDDPLKEMGIDLALVSCLDILRDPRWGRSEECFGEDPYLACRMAEAVVAGIQSQGVDVTAKHMCGQGETTGGVNASAARIGQRELREIHLPPVKACVDAGVTSFMAAYNEIDGVYCHGNPWLLTALLRGEYGFKGFVMSDGVAIDQLDAVTGDRVASGALALNSGVDMGLWDTAFSHLEEAVALGLVEEKRIDKACRRIDAEKRQLSLF